eukprot:756595-Hanusia_phi.AAC.1
MEEIISSHSAHGLPSPLNRMRRRRGSCPSAITVSPACTPVEAFSPTSSCDSFNEWKRNIENGFYSCSEDSTPCESRTCSVQTCLCLEDASLYTKSINHAGNFVGQGSFDALEFTHRSPLKSAIDRNGNFDSLCSRLFGFHFF